MSIIHHTFAPHASADHVWNAVTMTLTPWRYRSGESVSALHHALAEKFQGDVFLFASGRQGLLALLRALELKPGSEVILQSYTCVVLCNAIHAAGAVPVFVDLDPDTLNLDVDKTREAISPRTVAIICQHTFGIPAPIKGLRDLCSQRKLLLIEDCAHIMPDAAGPSDVAMIGDFVLFSFGRDKAISGVSGGAIVSRKPAISVAINNQWARADDLSLLEIFALLQYPLLYSIAKSVYVVGIGKLLLSFARAIGLLRPILNQEEKKGNVSPLFQKMPNACAYLALRQLRNLPHINDFRRRLTSFYLDASLRHGWPILGGIRDDLPLQKFPLFLPHAERVRKELQKEHIYLHDGWTDCVICPDTVDIDATGYREGSDPKAEDACERILSLPTHPTMSEKQAERLVQSLHRLVKQRL